MTLRKFRIFLRGQEVAAINYRKLVLDMLCEKVAKFCGRGLLQVKAKFVGSIVP